MYSTQFACLLCLSIIGSICGFAINNNGERSQVTTAIFSTTNTSPNQTESNQAKYGKELDLPNTYVRCGRCAASYAIAPEDLGSGKGR